MNKLKSIIVDLFVVNFQGELSQDNIIKLFLSNIISFILIIVAFIFVFISISNDNFILAYVFLMLVALHVFNYIFLMYTRRHTLNKIVCVSSIILLLFFVLFNPGPNGLAYMWFYSIPIISVLILDFRYAAYLNTSFIVIIILIFIYFNRYLPLEYTIELNVRFLLSYFSLSILIFTYAYINNRLNYFNKDKFYSKFELINTRKDFLSSLSSKIKNITKDIYDITNNSENISLTKEQKQHILDLQTSSNSLVNVMNNVLEISAFINDEKKSPRNFNIRLLINNTVDIFRNQEYEILIKYENDKNYLFFENPTLIKQIIFNILESIKQNNYLNGTEINIIVNIKEDLKSDNLFIKIILPTTQELSISNLTLTKTQKLIQRKNGKLKILNEKNKSTILFNLELPNNSFKSEDKEKFRTLLFGLNSEYVNKLNKFDIEQLKKMSVLLVSDTFSSQISIKSELEGYIKSIDIASNWDEVSKLMSYNNYNFIFIDFETNTKSALNLAKTIRDNEIEVGYKTTIIAINVDYLSSNINKTIQSGVDEYLSKPFEVERLINMLKIYFSN